MPTETRLKTGLHNTSEIGRLKKVMLHRPGKELENLMPEYLERLLFDDIPYLKVAQAEHDAFAQCLRENGADVVYLKDLVEKVRECYAPKCRLLMTQFRIDAYENKLLRGNLDLAFEVVENLMENAFKYGDGKEIRVTFGEEDYCQLIEVYNSGEAVAEEEMPHLFDSFYRGTNAGEKEGNGLGLYIGRQLMRKMEGDIFAVREQEGMRICLVFREDL